MGARVIKIERPLTGDICRQLYVSDVVIDGESTIFHAVNRNKESYVADLKDPQHMEKVKQLLSKADIMMHNFRPGVMERLGLDYETVKKINPQIVYASVSGYGDDGPWRDLPGQDLLLQAASGLCWLSHDHDKPPTPMGVAVVDILAGAHLVQGMLAALYQRAITGNGACVEVSMLESAIDFQFEAITCFLNDGNHLPERSAVNNGHAYVAAPYGVYKTADGYLALAMGNIQVFKELLQCHALETYTDQSDWFIKRDEIKKILKDHLATHTTSHWLSLLEPADIWCARVTDYENLMKEEGYKILRMEMEVKIKSGETIRTTRCPIRVDGERLVSCTGAPSLGEHNTIIEKQFQL